MDIQGAFIAVDSEDFLQEFGHREAGYKSSGRAFRNTLTPSVT